MKDLLSRPHRYEETMNIFSEVRGYLEDRSTTTCTIDSYSIANFAKANT